MSDARASRPPTGVSARPLRHWRADQLEVLASVLGQAATTWGRDWGLALTAPAPACRRACSADVDACPTPLGSGGAAAAWWTSDPQLRRLVAGGLFGGESAPGSIAAEVVAACLRDAGQRLRTALLLDADTASRANADNATGAWSGGVRVQLAPEVHLLVNAAAVEAVLLAAGHARANPRPEQGRPALVPLQQALAPLPYPLQVQLEGCEIGLGDLAALQQGDVLRIAHRTEQPAVVRNGHGDVLFGGFLARSGPRKAIELTPLH